MLLSSISHHCAVIEWRCWPSRDPPLLELPKLYETRPLASLRELGSAMMVECCWTQLRICDDLPTRFQLQVSKQVSPRVIAKHIAEMVRVVETCDAFGRCSQWLVKRNIFSAQVQQQNTAHTLEALRCLIRCINTSLVVLSQMLDASPAASQQGISFPKAEIEAAARSLHEIAVVWFDPMQRFLPASMFAFELADNIAPYLYCGRNYRPY